MDRDVLVHSRDPLTYPRPLRVSWLPELWRVEKSPDPHRGEESTWSTWGGWVESPNHRYCLTDRSVESPTLNGRVVESPDRVRVNRTKSGRVRST